MSHPNMNNDNTSDEVNLMPLFRYIKRKIDAVVNLIAFVYRVVEKHFLFITTFVAIGVVIGIANYFIATPVYRSTAIFTSNLLSNQYSESFINELKWLTREKNHEELSSLLKIGLEDAKKIRKIEYEGFIATAKDTVIGVPFKVHVFITDNSLLDTLQYCLSNYLENNSYATKRKNVKRRILTEYTELMQSEIMELDSIKRMEGIKNGFTETSLDSYGKILEMYTKKLHTMEQLALLKNYELIQEFTIFRKPAYPRRYFDTAICMIVLGILGFIMALRKEIIKLKNTRKNSLEINQVLSKTDS